MKLKDIATIAVLGVIGFALGMGVGMITGMFGALSMYVSAGFAAFFVGPVYTIMARQGAKTGDGLLLLVDLRRALRDHGLCRRDAPVPDRGHRRRDHRRRLRKQEEGVAVVFGIDVHLLDAHDSVRARSGIRWAGDFRREHLA